MNLEQRKNLTRINKQGKRGIYHAPIIGAYEFLDQVEISYPVMLGGMFTVKSPYYVVRSVARVQTRISQ
jgi:hypothetical protein